jgi:hypothetical protein
MRLYLLPLAASLSLCACAPRALYFRESTQVGFAADYNTSDTQPLATSFGYKRRIVAVVPTQERDIPEGMSERSGTNTGEALSLVSKFNVRAGTGEGVIITNNFASGMAARIMTKSVGSPQALNVLMHSAPIEVSSETGNTIEGDIPANEAVNERLARIGLKEVSGSKAPKPEGPIVMPPRDKGETPPKPEGPIIMPPRDKGKTPPKPEGPIIMPPRDKGKTPPKAKQPIVMPQKDKDETAPPKSERALPMPEP